MLTIKLLPYICFSDKQYESSIYPYFLLFIFNLCN